MKLQKTFISKENSSKIPYCPIIAGVSFIDQLNTIEEQKGLKFEKSTKTRLKSIFTTVGSVYKDLII